MNNLKNRVNLIGNLGIDPEVKELESGKKLARISLATSETYKSGDGKQVKNTEWHNLVAWGKKADIVEKYVTTGKEIAIEGKLTSRSYEDKEGVKRYVTEITISEILLLSK